MTEQIIPLSVIEDAMKQSFEDTRYIYSAIMMHPKDARGIIKRRQARNTARRMRKVMHVRVYYGQPLWMREPELRSIVKSHLSTLNANP